tara:strand:+ start:140 stop:265 length:126 start_codon:yes stop_codon:yes gene_type:complete
MAKKSYTLEKKNPKHTQIWEWEETPEVVEALKKLNETKSCI